MREHVGTVDEARKLVQDLIAPDLRALTVRVEEMEKRMNARFDGIEQVAKARHEAVLATIAASNASVMGALNLEKRMAKLETLEIERQV
jgi:hypothetical protein